MMDAPLYPPAAAFAPPVVQPHPLTLATVSLAELMGMPQAWAIVTKHFPAIQMMTSAPQAKPNLGNMTVLDFAQFAGMTGSPGLAEADAELKRLPAQDGAAR